MKHISFDFWNTLVVFNPDFSKARPQAMSEITGQPVENCLVTYKKVKRYLDVIAEVTGVAFTSIEVFNLFMRELGVAPSSQMAHALYTRIGELALAMPPLVLPETIDGLRRLTDSGLTISITSNTNYISGRFLRDIIRDWGVDFHHMLFSDEEGCSKPSMDMFDKIIDQTGYKPSDIVHIGDHPVCDGEGAQRAGMHRIVIENEKALPHVLDGLIVTV